MTLTADAGLAQDARRVDDVVAAAVVGDRLALYQLLSRVQPAVVRYCRARLGNGAVATTVARRICGTVVTKLPDLRDTTVVYAFVHGIAAAAVDAVARGFTEGAGLPGAFAALSPAQREVLVLRVAVGLSAAETASALGSTPDAVRRVQHEGLERLRRP
jgi:RNA polymerase sigma-70 factor, ECF subfamily